MLRRLLNAPVILDRVCAAILGLALWIRYPSHFLFSAPYLMDFNVYRAVARRLLDGEAASLYLPTTANSDMMVFRYAPAWALLWAPLAWLPLQAAAVLWTTANLAALLATLWLCAACCRRAGLQPSPILGVITVLCLLRPMAEEMGNGQVNLFWGLLVTLFISATMTRRPWGAAWALTGAALLKLPALIFLPRMLLRRQWGALARTSLLLLATALAPAVFLLPSAPWRLVADWFAALRQTGTAHAFDIGSQSFLALLGRFLTDDGYGLNLLSLSRPSVAALAFVSVGLLTLGAAWPARGVSEHPKRWLYESALLSVLMVVFSPSCLLPSYTALAYPIYVALAALGDQLRRRRIDPASAAFAVIGLAMVLLTHRKIWRLIGVTVWRGEAYVYLVFMVLPWFGLALMALLWRQLALTGRPDPASSART